MRHWLLGFALWSMLALAAEAKLKVVTTVPDLAAIAREVGAEQVEVISLSYPNQDPHFVDARPHLVLALNRADLLVVNGLDLEIGWLPVLITGARNTAIQPGSRGYLDASTLVPLKQIPQQRIDRSMGDIHPGGNPHFLTDPRNGGRVAMGIAQRLGELEPAHRKEFRARAAALVKAAETQAALQAKRFSSLPVVERHVATYHQSLIYLLDWLGLMEIGTIEPKPGIPPNPSHVAWLLGHMRKVHADVILQEDYYPTKIGTLLAEKAKATLVVLPGGTNFERGERYLDYTEALANKIYEAIAK